LTFGGGNARTGATTSSVGVPRSSWFAPLPGTVTTQPLVARNVPRPGDATVYVGTADGYVYALAANGYVRWRADLGRQTNPCGQVPDGWGVTGTPVIDPSTRTLYAADAIGRLHALDLATGNERPGWPVVLFRDYRRELVWGGLLLEDGSVYAGTGAFCDQPPMEGKLIRVQLGSRQASSFTTVPASLGGGGGIWGWGGPAQDPDSDSIFVVTGNAFQGGSNAGAVFSESAGYGEQLVELSPDLHVRGSSNPGLSGFTDLDFVGSPVVFDAGACGELVAAQAKNGMIFGWRVAAVSSGPVWSLALQKADAGAPLLTQPTWSPRDRSLFVVTASKLVRIGLDAGCRPKIRWQTTLGEESLYPSPTVAGGTVWVGLPVKDLSGVAEALLGVDVKTGRVKVHIPIAGVSFAPPSVVDGMLFLASMHGLRGGRFRVASGRPASALPEYTSRFDARHLWQSREDGVYSSDDGGRRWRRIHRGYAARVVRTGLRSGVIGVGASPTPCGCSTRQLATTDGGRTWKPLPGLGESFQGRGPRLYWWEEGSLFVYARAGSQRIAVADGTIVAAANLGNGVAALVDRRGKAPQVVVASGSDAQVETLPAGPAGAVPRAIAAAGATIVVTGRDDASPGQARDPTVTWRSANGGDTWTVG
jgi:outer membrane protein assembly factor BamB